MKYIIITIIFLSLILHADNNNTKNDKNSTKTININLKKQMELEKKYAKEQKFYMGDDYDLKSKEIDKDSLKNIEVPQPEYDFDITYIFEDESELNKSK